MAFQAAKVYGGKKQVEKNDQFLIVKPDSGWKYIDSYLKEGNETVIRALPSFDEYGKEAVALNPDGDPKNIIGSISPVFCQVPVVRWYKNGNHVLIGAIQKVDSQGNEVDFRTDPQTKFAERLCYKIFYEQCRVAKGLAPACPSHWLNWKGSIINRPETRYLVQCVAKTINGETKKSADGKLELQPYHVFSIPPSAATQFFQDLLTRDNPDEPLSMSNNRFGDFCSCAGGHWVRLVKYTTKKPDAPKEDRGKTEYKLSKTNQAYALTEETAKRLVLPWDDILYIPTVNEVMEMLLESFEPAALAFAFRNSPFMDYIPEHLRSSADDIPDPKAIKEIDVEVGIAASKSAVPVNRAPETVNRPQPIVEQETISLPVHSKPAFKSAEVKGKPAVVPEDKEEYNLPFEPDDSPVQSDVSLASDPDGLEGLPALRQEAPPAKGVPPSAVDKDRYAAALSKLTPRVQIK